MSLECWLLKRVWLMARPSKSWLKKGSCRATSLVPLRETERSWRDWEFCRSLRVRISLMRDLLIWGYYGGYDEVWWILGMWVE